MMERFRSWFGRAAPSDDEFARQRAELLERMPAPVIWLFGKTGGGKSSIVRYVTGSTAAQVGDGFRPQTRASARFDFPSDETPIVRFLDTRGLGETAYDPTEDLARFSAETHVVLVVARLLDHALGGVVEPLRTIRAARPDRPVVLALTCLHEAYPREQHPADDPFQTGGPADWVRDERLPESVRRSLAEQCARFDGLVDRIVPVDLTPPEDGWEQPEFGGTRLHETLCDLLPEACRQALLQLHAARGPQDDPTAAQALPKIVAYSTLAATAAVAPLPWVDIPVVLALQTRLIYVLADLYDRRMHVKLLLSMAGAVGGRLALRFAVQAPLKLAPVVGLPLNAAMAFAYTFALGKACCWYFAAERAGAAPTQDELNRVWGEQLQEAVALWKRRRA